MNESTQKGYWEALRATPPGGSVWLPCSPNTAGGHAAATLGKGNYRVKREADGARVCHTPNWRRGA